jgi:hypothetical protein
MLTHSSRPVKTDPARAENPLGRVLRSTTLFDAFLRFGFDGYDGA